MNKMTKKIVKTVGNKSGKALSIGGISAEMLKFGEAVTNWMHTICNLAWRERKVPEISTDVTIVSVYQRKKGQITCLWNVLGKV